MTTAEEHHAAQLKGGRRRPGSFMGTNALQTGKALKLIHTVTQVSMAEADNPAQVQ